MAWPCTNSLEHKNLFLIYFKVLECVFILHQNRTKICQIFHEAKIKREFDNRLRCSVRGRAGLTNRLRILLRHERKTHESTTQLLASQSDRKGIPFWIWLEFLSWPWKILPNKCLIDIYQFSTTATTTKLGIYQQGKKTITTTQFQASWVGWLGFHLLSALRDNTERIQGCHQVSRLRCNGRLFHTGSGMLKVVGQPTYATFHSKETRLFAGSSP